jgi:tellurite resistance protein
MVFLIIFGSRAVTTTTASGEFACPSCDAKRGYDRRRVRRFFTLYFLPIIPLETLGEYVECTTCRGTFKPAVLERKDHPAEFEAAVKRVMVKMMLADGKILDDEIEAVQRIYEKLAKRPLARSDVDAEVTAAKADRRPLHAYLESLVGTLNDAGKEIVLKAAFFVAASDGELHEDESRLLAELAAALEMSPSHFKGVIDELVAA